MAHMEPSRVRQRSVTTGTGTYTLVGAAALSFRTFAAALVDGDTVDCVVVMGANYELGRYTYSAGTLARTAIVKSSNGDAAVDWPSGTKDIAATRIGTSDLSSEQLAELLALLPMPGIPYVWSTNTASSDPASGKLKIDNATPASAAALYISETDAEGNAMAAVLAAWDDGTSTVRGRLRVEDPVTGAFLEMEITGTLTDNGAWDTFVIQNATGTVHADATDVRLFFTPKGDKGDTGAAGAAGATGPAGAGDVVGPASATDNAIARFNLTTGKLIQDTSGATISDNFALTLAGATITTSEPILNVSQTWNAGGVTFVGSVIDATDTASATASRLMEWRLGGVAQAGIQKNGRLVLGLASGSSSGNVAIQLGAFSNNGLFSGGNGLLNVAAAGADIVGWRAAGQLQRGSLVFAFTAGNVAPGTTGADATANDLKFYRDAAAGVFALGNGVTNAAALRVYRTTDAAASAAPSNYERAAINSGSGYFELAAETAGTGTDDIDLRLTPAGAGRVMFGTHSAIGAETVTGFITIKDAGGTTRKLAVVS